MDMTEHLSANTHTHCLQSKKSRELEQPSRSSSLMPAAFPASPLLPSHHFILLATLATPGNCQAFFHLQPLSLLIAPLSRKASLSLPSLLVFTHLPTCNLNSILLPPPHSSRVWNGALLSMNSHRPLWISPLLELASPASSASQADSLLLSHQGSPFSTILMSLTLFLLRQSAATRRECVFAIFINLGPSPMSGIVNVQKVFVVWVIQ